MPSSSSPWLPVSAIECSASASIALLPEMTAATAFAIAIAQLANSAMKTLFFGLCSLDTVQQYPLARVRLPLDLVGSSAGEGVAGPGSSLLEARRQPPPALCRGAVRPGLGRPRPAGGAAHEV